MPDTLTKLRPDRDLQCYFFEPSAIAALSSTSETGFTVSGTWRQQFDWAVIEWNRDNVHEHPAFRYLPDGDLSGLVLTYQETRTNCIPLDSDLFATVDWPSLRIWASTGGVEQIYYVGLNDPSIATPVAGSFQSAYAEFTLSGTVTVGDYVGIAYLGDHYTYQFASGDILANAVLAIAAAINASPLLQAVRTGTTIQVYYTNGATIAASTTGANGNRFGMYSYTCSSTGGASTASWDSAVQTFAGGTSPTQWQITIDFTTLAGYTSWPPPTGITPVTIPTNNIRKMRWTYAADLQAGSFVRSEFEVVVSNWTVTGTNGTYSVAGTGTQRVEDDNVGMAYSGSWDESRGNYSGGLIHHTSTLGDSVTLSYDAMVSHTLYIGTRYVGTGAQLSFTVDGVAAGGVNLLIPLEDVLIRWPVGSYCAGNHTIVVTHAGPDGNDFYFDFIEAVSSTTDLPVFSTEPKSTLATDWDTEHSLALAPERTAWFLDSMGFVGRANHYVGALWFYELVCTGQVYASGTVTFTGTPAWSSIVTVTLGQVGEPSSDDVILQKLIHAGDTLETIATAYALELNRGYTGVWASASANIVTIYARTMGIDGDNYTLTTDPTSGAFIATPSGATFAGGMNGIWRTDLAASPRLNRAVRDWSLSYFTAMQGYGIDVTASFSMELGNGDPSASVGIAQVGPSGDPILLPTPSLQTNFSPTSLAFWQEVYAEIAGIQASAGATPYLQFGEVQWWYFPNNGAGIPYSGMPFYDAWNTSQFATAHGHAMATITSNSVDPTLYPDEVAYLPTVIGNFTNAIMTFVQSTQPSCLFEVLYPTDVNQTTFNQAINFPTGAWTPTALACLKTENFGFTLGRDLDSAFSTLLFGQSLGFAATERSQLVGVGDSTTAWAKEARAALGRGFESAVLFALDQFCLIGYRMPLPQSFRRSVRLGS